MQPIAQPSGIVSIQQLLGSLSPEVEKADGTIKPSNEGWLQELPEDSDPATISSGLEARKILYRSGIYGSEGRPSLWFPFPMDREKERELINERLDRPFPLPFYGSEEAFCVTPRETFNQLIVEFGKRRMFVGAIHLHGSAVPLSRETLEKMCRAAPITDDDKERLAEKTAGYRPLSAGAGRVDYDDRILLSAVPQQTPQQTLQRDLTSALFKAWEELYRQKNSKNPPGPFKMIKHPSRRQNCFVFSIGDCMRNWDLSIYLPGKPIGFIDIAPYVDVTSSFFKSGKDSPLFHVLGSKGIQEWGFNLISKRFSLGDRNHLPEINFGWYLRLLNKTTLGVLPSEEGAAKHFSRHFFENPKALDYLKSSPLMHLPGNGTFRLAFWINAAHWMLEEGVEAEKIDKLRRSLLENKGACHLSVLCSQEEIDLKLRLRILQLASLILFLNRQFFQCSGDFHPKLVSYEGKPVLAAEWGAEGEMATIPLLFEQEALLGVWENAQAVDALFRFLSPLVEMRPESKRDKPLSDIEKELNLLQVDRPFLEKCCRKMGGSCAADRASVQLLLGYVLSRISNPESGKGREILLQMTRSIPFAASRYSIDIVEPLFLEMARGFQPGAEKIFSAVFQEVRDRIKTTCTLSEGCDAPSAAQNSSGIGALTIPSSFCTASEASRSSESVQFISIRSLKTKREENPSVLYRFIQAFAGTNKKELVQIGYDLSGSSALSSGEKGDAAVLLHRLTAPISPSLAFSRSIRACQNGLFKGEEKAALEMLSVLRKSLSDPEFYLHDKGFQLLVEIQRLLGDQRQPLLGGLARKICISAQKKGVLDQSLFEGLVCRFGSSILEEAAPEEEEAFKTICRTFWVAVPEEKRQEWLSAIYRQGGEKLYRLISHIRLERAFEQKEEGFFRILDYKGEPVSRSSTDPRLIPIAEENLRRCLAGDLSEACILWKEYRYSLHPEILEVLRNKYVAFLLELREGDPRLIYRMLEEESREDLLDRFASCQHTGVAREAEEKRPGTQEEAFHRFLQKREFNEAEKALGRIADPESRFKACRCFLQAIGVAAAERFMTRCKQENPRGLELEAVWMADRLKGATGISAAAHDLLAFIKREDKGKLAAASGGFLGEAIKDYVIRTLTCVELEGKMERELLKNLMEMVSLFPLFTQPMKRRCQLIIMEKAVFHADVKEVWPWIFRLSEQDEPRDRIKTTCTLSEGCDAPSAAQNSSGIGALTIPSSFCTASEASRSSESVQFISIRSPSYDLTAIAMNFFKRMEDQCSKNPLLCLQLGPFFIRYMLGSGALSEVELPASAGRFRSTFFRLAERGYFYRFHHPSKYMSDAKYAHALMALLFTEYCQAVIAKNDLTLKELEKLLFVTAGLCLAVEPHVTELSRSLLIREVKKCYCLAREKHHVPRPFSSENMFLADVDVSNVFSFNLLTRVGFSLLVLALFAGYTAYIKQDKS